MQPSVGHASNSRNTYQVDAVAMISLLFALPLPSVAVLILFGVCCMQLLLSSFRLLMLWAGLASGDLAPTYSLTRFLLFAIGAVAPPIIHVRHTIHTPQRTAQPSATLPCDEDSHAEFCCTCSRCDRHARHSCAGDCTKSCELRVR